MVMTLMMLMDVDDVNNDTGSDNNDVDDDSDHVTVPRCPIRAALLGGDKW